MENFDLQDYHTESRNIEFTAIKLTQRSDKNIRARRDALYKELDASKVVEPVKEVVQETPVSENMSVFDSRLAGVKVLESGFKPIRITSSMLEKMDEKNSSLNTVKAEKLDTIVERKYETPEIATEYPRSEIIEKENSDIVDREFSDNLRKNEGEIRSMSRDEEKDRFESYSDRKPVSFERERSYSAPVSTPKFQSDRSMDDVIRNYSDSVKNLKAQNSKLDELNETLKEEEEKRAAAEDRKNKLIEKYIKRTAEIQNMYDEKNRQEAEQRRKLESTKNDIDKLDRDIDRLESLFGSDEDDSIKRMAA